MGSRRSRIGIAAIVTMALISGLVAITVQAVPRYSARYDQDCALCHVNPTGGGLRTLYASQYLVPEEIAWTRGKLDALDEIGPQISKTITIGTDLRQLFIRSDLSSSLQNFFEMQGDIYLAFQPDEKVVLYYDHGINTSYELFGLAQVLPLAGYAKVGRFVPSYGWKFDDHTMFVRRELGFFPPANSDVGVEFGISPGRLDLQLDLLNGNPGQTIDNDSKVALSLNAIYRFRLASLGAALGLSGYHNPGESQDFESAGLYGYLTWKGFTWLGEADVLGRTWVNGDSSLTGLVASNEFSYLVRQGLELKATYDFFDPDIDRKSGSETRLGGGVFAMPASYFTGEVLIRWTEFDDGPAVDDEAFYELVLQAHFLY
jgi:hypothetical protein